MAEIEKEADEARQILASEQPTLDAAIEAVKEIKTSDIDYIKIMKKPSETMEKICSCIYVLMYEQTKVEWSDVTSMFAKSSFMHDLVYFELEKLKDRTIDFVAKVLSKISKEEAIKSYVCLGGVHTWLTNMIKYYEVYKIVAPKQRNVKIQEELLEKSKKDLDKLTAKIEKLTNDMNAKKTELETKQKEERELS